MKTAVKVTALGVDITVWTEKSIREYRNALLKESDWTQLQDSPPNKALWATYRQELRDITAQDGFPNNVLWPTKPTE